MKAVGPRISVIVASLLVALLAAVLVLLGQSIVSRASAQVENDEDVPLRQYDKILFHPKNAIPVDFEPDNQLFVVPVEDVVAVFRREED